MDIQYILRTVTGFAAELQRHTSGAIKKTIHQDMSLLGYKLLLGIVIVAVVIFSLFQFGYAYLTLLSMYKDELTLKLVSFGILSIVGIVALYFLFKNKNNLEIKLDPMPTNAFDVPSLISSFATGIMEGYQTRKQQNQNMHSSQQAQHIHNTDGMNSIHREI